MLATLLFLLQITSSNTLHVVGDSQCAGVSFVVKNVTEMRRWSTIKSTCQVGSTTSQWVVKIDSVGIRPGDDVLVFLGSNDWWGKPNARLLLAKLKGTRCVFVGPPLIRGKAGAADTLKTQVEDDRTCRYLDSRQLHLVQPDGVHTSESIRWLRAGVAKLLE